MTKAFGIKNFKWATCSKLINRHKILLDMKQGKLIASEPLSNIKLPYKMPDILLNKITQSDECIAFISIET